ncbi:anti-sigma factor [Nocardia sp. NPDC004604]|uniref:anti-sigma factor n=1 Tax=Nocardia sp. NPDC004604 TaxID=3157013 RepID=UPI0033B9BCBB
MSDHDRPAADLLDLAYPYALDSLDTIERRRIERRLEDVDEAIAAEFATTVYDLREVLASLTVVDAMAPPPELENALLRALDQSLGTDHHPVRHRWRGRLGWVTAAAAVIITLGAGVAMVMLHTTAPARGVSTELMLAQPDLRTRLIPVSFGGALTVRTSAGIATAMVSFDGIPAPPDGRTYQVWLVSADGVPHSVAVVVSAAAPSVLTRFDTVDTLAMTVEPAGGSARPTSTPIVSLGLA